VGHPRLAGVTMAEAFQISADVIFRELDGEAVLLDLASGRYFGLNAVGTRTWALLAAGTSLADATAALAAEFDAPAAEIAADVKSLVSDLLARGLLVAAAPPGGA
jgi:hypothetical protein